jgi:hypothetical protein
MACYGIGLPGCFLISLLCWPQDANERIRVLEAAAAAAATAAAISKSRVRAVRGGGVQGGVRGPSTAARYGEKGPYHGGLSPPCTPVTRKCLTHPGRAECNQRDPSPARLSWMISLIWKAGECGGIALLRGNWPGWVRAWDKQAGRGLAPALDAGPLRSSSADKHGTALHLVQELGGRTFGY